MIPKQLCCTGLALALAACDVTPAVIIGPGSRPAGIYAVYVSPPGYAFIVGETVKLNAVATTRECDIEFCRESVVPATFAWASSDDAVVTVVDGLVRAIGPGTADVWAIAGNVRASARIRVSTAYVPLAHVGPGGLCALTDAGAAYCWGGIPFNSPDTAFLPGMPQRLAGGKTFTSIAAGNATACGIAADSRGYCWGSGPVGTEDLDYSGNPLLIAGGLTFRALSAGRRNTINAGNEHTCGVAVDGGAWCWGANDAGQLGTAATLTNCYNGEIGHDYPCTNTPARVAGGIAFTAISAGGTHTCALAPDGTAYCWGDNTWGQLGDSSTVSRAWPEPVRGAPPFVALAAGSHHTCGLSGEGIAFCWGRNHAGQLGLGVQDVAPHSAPAPVSGSVTFASLDAAAKTCALTPAGGAYCWGGDGPAVPTPVPGGLVFRSVGVGPGAAPAFFFSPTARACGVATDERGYCWFGVNQPVPLVGPIER